MVRLMTKPVFFGLHSVKKEGKADEIQSQRAGENEILA